LRIAPSQGVAYFWRTWQNGIGENTQGPMMAVILLALASASAMAVDARDRGFIRLGMGEGEVLLKIGKPDHEALNRVVRGEPEEKTWTYFPHIRDPQTMTIIRFHSGQVTVIDRQIVR
jgi:hypothetical protein